MPDTAETPPPISLLDTLKLAIGEFESHERNRASFDGQVRNMAWLLITLATFAYLGLQTPPLVGTVIYIAVVNWVSTACAALAIVASAFNAARAYLSKKYSDPPSLALNRIWEKKLEEYVSQHGSDHLQDAHHPQQKAMEYLLTIYAACAARNKDINDTRYKHIGRSKRLFVIAVAFFAVEALSTISIHFMETYDAQRQTQQADLATSTAAISSATERE